MTPAQQETGANHVTCFQDEIILIPNFNIGFAPVRHEHHEQSFFTINISHDNVMSGQTRQRKEAVNLCCRYGDDDSLVLSIDIFLSAERKTISKEESFC